MNKIIKGCSIFFKRRSHEKNTGFFNCSFICFGIYNENDSEDEVIGNIKISKELEDKYSQEDNYIQTYFTLISYSENSIIDLFRSFNEWLKNFPDNKIKKMATKRFHNSIKVQYKKEISNKN